MLLELQGIEITPARRGALDRALKLLAEEPREHRTLTELTVQVQRIRAAHALRPGRQDPRPDAALPVPARGTAARGRAPDAHRHRGDVGRADADGVRRPPQAVAPDAPEAERGGDARRAHAGAARPGSGEAGHNRELPDAHPASERGRGEHGQRAAVSRHRLQRPGSRADRRRHPEARLPRQVAPGAAVWCSSIWVPSRSPY